MISGEPGWGPRHCLRVILILAACGPADAQRTGNDILIEGLEEVRSEEGDEAPAAHRGRVSLAYQFQDTEGLISNDGSILGSTTTDLHSLRLSVDYRLNDRWELHASLPFMRKRSSGGPGAHRLDVLVVPHPEATFLDDGDYHSGWQDWALGASRHDVWRGFEVVSQATLYLPTHDYSHFANAAIGQNQKKLNLGVDLSRRIGFSNFYYSVGYSYELVERTLDIPLNKHHLRSSLGYFFSPRLAGRVFINARDSQGRGTDDIGSDRTSELFYQHDRISRHDYVIGGVAATWQFSDLYAVTLTGVGLLRGRNVHNLRRAYELQFTRSF